MREFKWKIRCYSCGEEYFPRSHRKGLFDQRSFCPRCGVVNEDEAGRRRWKNHRKDGRT